MNASEDELYGIYPTKIAFFPRLRQPNLQDFPNLYLATLTPYLPLVARGTKQP